MIQWWGPIICEHYGGTEAGVLTFCNTAEWGERPGTVGRAMNDVSLRILDTSRADCRSGDVGEIFGRRLMFPDFDYHGDSAKRKAVEHDGLISLGDRGYLDQEGYLYLTGRSSDMIISGGVNIYPAEVEAELLKVPDVADCAVLGIPDNDLGESVLAIIQPVAGVELDPEVIALFLRERLSSYKVPKKFEFRNSLPREDSGKIFKRKLREPYWADVGRDI
jgi:long-chain acyl-CoA synthetase